MGNSKIKKRPAKLFLAYSAFTFFLYYFGAYDYPKNNQVLLIVYLVICNAAMYFGFIGGCSKSYQIQPDAPAFPIKRWMSVLMWISLLTILPKFYIFTRISFANANELVEKILLFGVDAQDLYTEHHKIEAVTGIWKYINYLVVLSSPFVWMYYVLSMLLWEKLSIRKKIASVFIWVMTILQYVISGTNVGIIEFIGFFATCRIVAGIGKKKKVRAKRHRIVTVGGTQIRIPGKKILLSAGAIVLAVLVFSTVMNSRIGKSYTNSLGSGVFRAFYSEEGVNRILPDSVKPVYAYISRYFAGGYRGLALSFDMPFQSTYGVGHSSFLLNNAGSLSEELWERTYNMQVYHAYGYPYDASWHTAFLWIANDVSLAGVPIVLLILMWLFGKAWSKYLDTGNLAAFLLFMIYAKIMFFISANNQAFRTFDTMFAFWALALCMRQSDRWNWRIRIDKL